MKRVQVWVLAIGLLIAGCWIPDERTRGVYLLFAVADADGRQVTAVPAIVNYLLATLEPKDSLAVANIDTGSFSEKDIVASVTFAPRPSLANHQKRMFKQKFDSFIAQASGSPYSDISGGILQAIEYLNSIGCKGKYILICSDLKQVLAKGFARDVPFQLSGFTVIALNPIKSSDDNARNPERVLIQAESWREKIEGGNGQWEEVADIVALAAVLEE